MNEVKIASIDRIKDFGVFRNYKAGNVKEFRKYNVIFGWNYSGKTTLSRIFQSLQDRKLVDGFEKGEFSLRLSDGSFVSTSNLQDHQLNVRVFNADYVRRNLKWEERHNNLEPIFIVGEESIEVQEKLEKLEEENTRLVDERKKLLNSIQAEEDSLAREITAEARSITQELFLGRNFNRNHLEKLLEMPDIISKRLEDSQFKKDRVMAIPGQERNELQYQNVELVDESIVEKTKVILTRTVSPSKTLHRLRDNVKLESWVRHGLALNRGKEQCGFCGQPLTDTILDDLDAHFSKDYEDFISEVREHVAFLERKIVDLRLPEAEYLYQDLQEQYGEHLKVLSSEVDKYNSLVKDLLDRVKKKLENPMLELNVDSTVVVDYPLIRSEIENIKSIIIHHNDRVAHAAKYKEEAVERLKLHYAAVFCEKSDYRKRKELITKSKLELQDIKDMEQQNRVQIDKYSIQISELAKGANKVKEYIELYFGYNTLLRIDVTKDNQFRLMRGTKLATHLSEGEKTAISFAYFLASLHEQKTANKMSETVVFIDDPISSLDANHLFNTYALIKSIFYKRCAQLFVSTHNYEFFKLMKDAFKPSSRTKLKCVYFGDGLGNMDCKAGFFTVQRTDGGSALANLDCLLCHFHSEYFYVYKELHDYLNSGSSDPYKAYTMPNLLRRFLEIYMKFNHPEKANTGLALENLINVESEKLLVEKVINELSHSLLVERSIKMIEPHEIRKSIVIVFSAIEESRPDYYAELKSVADGNGLAQAAPGLE